MVENRSPRKNVDMKKFSLLVVILACAFCFSSCNGKSAKTTERVVKEAFQEYRKVSQNDGVRYLRTKHKLEQIDNAINQRNVCHTCDGYGVVYHIDNYGNIITDYYGNPALFTCDQCGGSGKAY